MDWPPRREKLANTAANKHGGEFDGQKLGAVLSDIRLADTEIDLVGIAKKDFEGSSLLDDPESFLAKLNSSSQEVEPPAGEMRPMEKYDAGKNIYDIPNLLPDMCGDIDRPQVFTHGYNEDWDGDFIQVLGRRRNPDAFPRSWLAFYTWGVDFEKYWYAPAAWTRKIKDSGLKGVIAANFSVMFEDPAAWQIWNTKIVWLSSWMEQRRKVLEEAKKSKRKSIL